MRQRLRSFEARALPHGRRDALRQFLLFGVAYALYQVVRGLVNGNDVAQASWNATRIIDLERTLHVFVEPSIQAWTANIGWLMVASDWIYLNSHYVVTIGVLIFLYTRRHDSFCYVRNAFMISMAIALVGYAVYPTAPPRLMPEWGFADSIHQFTGFAIEDHSVKALLNLYAAVPSIHVCFAILVGWPMAKLVRRPWLKVAVAPVSAVGYVCRGRHRKSLPHRRRPRCPHGRGVDAHRRRTAGPRASACMVVRRRVDPGRRRGDGQLMPEHTERVRPPRANRPRRENQEISAAVRERLIESRLTPNAISLTGFALNLAAAALVVDRLFFLAGVAFIVGSIMDTLDGRYSRMSGKGTPFGAFLDSTLDRLEEGIVLTAVAAYFASRHDQLAVAAVVAAVLFSLMVSYTRARAEALGVACKVGLATRPVRVVILSAGLVFARGASLGNFQLLAPAVYVLAVLAVLTTVQRILHVRRELLRSAA